MKPLISAVRTLMPNKIMRTNKNKKTDARETGRSGFEVGRCQSRSVHAADKFAALPTIKEMARPILPQIRFN